MGNAQKIKINYHTKVAYETASSLPCPRSTIDVYALGVNLQYCVRAKYLEIADYMNNNDHLSEQIARQLTIKSEIGKLSVYNLNIQLTKFYDQGGPIMEDPVTSEMAKEIQPFFRRIMGLFLQSLDETASRLLTKQIGAEEMTSAVKQQIIETYNTLGKMFTVEEIERAFGELAEIIQA